jgi:hypothetical protein
VINPGRHFVAYLWLCLGCANGQRHSADPPAHHENTQVSASASPAPSSVATQAVSASPAPSQAASTATVPAPQADFSAGTTTSKPTAEKPDASPAETAAVPPLVDSSGKPLAQTEELPSFDSPSFRRRIGLLFDAIVKDDPTIAAPAFFPLVAYEQVKAISQPARDHKFRLMAAFARDIHEYHRLLGRNRAQAKLLGIVPPSLAPRLMKPGTEGNRLSYYRLLRSRLKVDDGSGAPRFLEITSLISWRGQWYVVHLNGFK